MSSTCHLALVAGNTADIEAHLVSVNGRATARTVTAFWRVEEIADAVDADLATNFPGLPVTFDIVVSYRPAGPSASSYEHPSLTTEVWLTRESGVWHYIGANRVMVFPKESARTGYSCDAFQSAAMTAAAKGKRPLRRLSALEAPRALTAHEQIRLAAVLSGHADQVAA